MLWRVADLLIRGFKEGDAEAVLANIRPADRDEADALLGPGNLESGIGKCVTDSVMLWTGAVGEEVAFVFGLAPVSMLGDQGIPWLVGTPLIDKHRGSFIRLSRSYISLMLAAYPTLLNIVDVRNVKSIAWLKRMGFTILPAEPAGVDGMPFYPFFKSTDGGGLSAG